METAIVIGSGVGGLVVAKVLSKHFQKVIIVERNKLEDTAEARKGVPQANHAHVLLSKGAEIVDELLPRTSELMKECKAIQGDFGEVYWMQHSKWKRYMHAGTHTYFASRATIEWVIRTQIRDVENVQIMDEQTVTDLLYDANENRITGLQITDKQGQNKTLHAEFIIDASGRGSQSMKWFDNHQIPAPKIDTNEVGVTYVSRYFKVPEKYPDIPSIIVSPDIPKGKKYGVFFNNGSSILYTLTGVLDQEVPRDEKGFMEFSKTLEHDVLEKIIKYLEPASEIYAFSYPRTRWIRYDKMKKFPKGYLVMGDAMCSFNPIYGQGMTVASYEAHVLDTLLSKGRKLDGIHKPFFKKSRSIISLAWGLSSSDMLKYPEAIGKRTMMIRFMNWYMKQVMLASGSTYINGKFLKVMTFLKSPGTLFTPIFMIRLFFTRLFRTTYNPDFESIITKLEEISKSEKTMAEIPVS